MTALREQSETTVLNQIYQASVEDSMSGVAREMAQRYFLMWPPELGAKLMSEERINELVYDQE